MLKILGVLGATSCNVANQSTVGDGLYQVNGTNASNPLTDDGIMIVMRNGLIRFKVGTTHGALMSKYSSNDWQISVQGI